jgi:hypothetical protein
VAASRIPRPGTKYGPCKEACAHIDCKAQREEAKTNCEFCHSAIGFGREFYYLSADDLAHAECYERHIEEEQCGK